MLQAEEKQAQEVRKFMYQWMTGVHCVWRKQHFVVIVHSLLHAVIIQSSVHTFDT